MQMKDDGSEALNEAMARLGAQDMDILETLLELTSNPQAGDADAEAEKALVKSYAQIAQADTSRGDGVMTTAAHLEYEKATGDSMRKKPTKPEPEAKPWGGKDDKQVQGFKERNADRQEREKQELIRRQRALSERLLRKQ